MTLYVDFTQVVALLLIHGEHCAGAHTSGVQVIYWTLQLLAYVIRVRSLSLQKPEVISQFRVAPKVVIKNTQIRLLLQNFHRQDSDT